ncbi:cyclin-like protein [Kockovaella imperatae]|uniref:Cyclin-like protein n=1 Tax=Kockovaella imperatae TaxID=4999 RepID=A0A1Y1U6K6_9TREE|nr:cyclin-like protein [Kockovaella imperatae]ORX33632.1 cyclin-like protein [Kockovaella imperatae]
MTTDAASASSIHLKRYKPYFTPAEVERLSAKQRGKLSVSREERSRQQACGFIDAVGVRCGFPRRTIATAQTLYMRFHLFFPYKDFAYTEVSLTVLYVSSKLHDTLKKPRDIILASYALRFPQLVKKGQVDIGAVDQNVLEGERQRVMNIERLVLETMCFKFGVHFGLGLVVKLSKTLRVQKDLSQRGWRVAVDCHRTHAPLSFPPHVIAIASLYTACLLHMGDQSKTSSAEMDNQARDVASLFGNIGSWEQAYHTSHAQVDDVTHAILDLYITILSTPPTDPSVLSTPSPVSPKDQLPSSSHHPISSFNTAYRLAIYWTAQRLTELKIHLRDKRPGVAVVPLNAWPLVDTPGQPAEAEGMGRNDATVRFVWDQAV